MSSHLVSYTTTSTHETTLLAEQGFDPVEKFYAHTHTHTHRLTDMFAGVYFHLDLLFYLVDHIRTSADSGRSSRMKKQKQTPLNCLNIDVNITCSVITLINITDAYFGSNSFMIF